MLVQVKSGHGSSRDIHGLVGAGEWEQAAIGVRIPREEPAREIRVTAQRGRQLRFTGLGKELPAPATADHRRTAVGGGHRHAAGARKVCCGGAGTWAGGAAGYAGVGVDPWC